MMIVWVLIAILAGQQTSLGVFQTQADCLATIRHIVTTHNPKVSYPVCVPEVG